MTKKVTEEMLRAILPVEESCLERPIQEPLVLDVPNSGYEQNMVEEVSAALAQISSDVPRGNGSIDLDRCEDYWLGVVWAIAGLNVSKAKEIALEWSKQSDRFDSEGFEDAWNSFDPSHDKPIGFGSVIALANRLRPSGFAELVLPLPSSDPLPPFPEKCVPPSFRPWLRDVAFRMDIPLEYVAAASLVAASSIIGRRAAVRPKIKDPWEEHANLWGLVIAQPGELKSPSTALALKPVRKLERDARDKWNKEESDLRKNLSLLKTYESVAKNQLKKVIEKEDAPGDVAEKKLASVNASILEVEARLAKGGRRYLCNDATTEKLAELCQANPYGLLVSRDEIAGWFETLTKSGKEGDREFFLEAWSGDGEHSYDRIGRGTLYIPHVCLSLFGTIQPGKLDNFVNSAGKDGKGADGLLQRFQILLYPDARGPRKHVDESPKEAAENKYAEIFQNLADEKWKFLCTMETGIPLAGPKDSSYYYFHFDEDAQSRATEWFIALESKISSIVEHAFKSHIAKYRGLMPRLALNYFLIEASAGTVTTQEISLEAVEFAIALCDQLEAHAKKLWLSAIDPGIVPARAMADRILSGVIYNRMSLSQIQQSKWSKLSSVEDVRLGADQLESWGWLKQAVIETGGRRSTIIQLNPKLRL